MDFERNFIMRVDFNDDTCVHYIMSDIYLIPILTAKPADYCFLNNLPGVILTADMIKSVVSVEAFHIDNGNFIA